MSASAIAGLAAGVPPGPTPFALDILSPCDGGSDAGPGAAELRHHRISRGGPNSDKEMEKDTRVVIEIGGMSCASCVAKLERCIGDVPGVKSASVNLLTESAGMRL